jgi:uncharacterized membrane protein YesL
MEIVIEFFSIVFGRFLFGFVGSVITYIYLYSTFLISSKDEKVRISFYDIFEKSNFETRIIGFIFIVLVLIITAGS